MHNLEDYINHSLKKGTSHIVNFEISGEQWMKTKESKKRDKDPNFGREKIKL